MKHQQRIFSRQTFASTVFMQLRSSWPDFNWAFPSNGPQHGVKHREDIKQLKRRGGDRHSNSKWSSSSCCGQVSQRSAANFSLECLDDSSFTPGLLRLQTILVECFLPVAVPAPVPRMPAARWGSSTHGSALHYAAHWGCVPVGQATSFCCKEPLALRVSSCQTCWHSPSPLRHPNHGRVMKAEVQFKPNKFWKHWAVMKQCKKLIF